MSTSSAQTITLGGGSAGASPLVVPCELGPVRLVRKIGAGGMGEVWLGRHSLLARDVAVKFLQTAVLGPDDPHFERFLQEARTAACVRHPHLVIVHDANLVGDVPYLVMEHIDGPSLAEVLVRSGPLSVPAMLAAMDAIAAGVGALHERGIVHRDIKPSNVLLDRDGRVVVSDFGLACAGRMERRGALAGTLAYMAPEMFDGTASPRSDVYAMGMTTFQLLTGQPPFNGTVEEVCLKHRNDPLPVEPLQDRETEPALIEVLARATHKNPTFRYKTATHFLRALKEAVPDAQAWSRGAEIIKHEAAGSRPMEVLASALKGGTPVSGSYYDHLANVAATKRRRQGDAASPEAPTAAEATPDRRALVADVPCAHCGYNLKGLGSSGTCPECGTPVEVSLRRDRLMFADTEWLRRIRKGLILTGWTGLGGTLLVVLAALGFGKLSAAAIGMRFKLIGCLVAILGVVGVYMITTAEHQRRRYLMNPASRWLARVIAVLMAFTIVLSTIHVRFSSGWLSNVLSLLCIVFLMQYLRTLGARIPDRRVVRHGTEANVVLLTSALLLGIGTGVHGLMGDAGLLGNIVGSVRALAALVLAVAPLWISLKLLSISRNFGRVIAEHVPLAAAFGPFETSGKHDGPART